LRAQVPLCCPSTAKRCAYSERFERSPRWGCGVVERTDGWEDGKGQPLSS